jgi:hypothetical protein
VHTSIGSRDFDDNHFPLDEVGVLLDCQIGTTIVRPQDDSLNPHNTSATSAGLPYRLLETFECPALKALTLETVLTYRSSV